MRRDSIEKITATLVVFLITAFSLGLILVLANLVFEWDIFPPYSEKIIYFILGCSVIVVLAAAIVNIMLNISRLAFFSQKIAEKLVEK